MIDVQLVQEFVHGSEGTYEFEVVPSERAISIIKLNFPDLAVTSSSNGISVGVSKEEIPHLVKLFVEAEIQVFGIKEQAKTLEDRFLEVTSAKEAVDRV